ncbi:MAG: NUDIX hydrolase [Faecalicatena sp.]|uniref:NUDIX hydrolase n=1 Tax=Faecalicatena sp. TaxID=2005360 RepID=UPI0025889077|nr:NUDIX hydrolase [Faecalicatena sp.]MCI6466031.1 NUDIX hydrolase [Faecalicatena sp.]MDY5620039.1 NUDIX hydrolase [Lachnospiraceae bacterium]
MPSFLEDITPFYGTGERNAAGQTLEEFLEAYDPYRYKSPSCTTDAVVFSCMGELGPSLEGLKILLVKRSNHPTIGFWALPGGFIDLKENLDDTARRELMEETGVEDLALEQIGAYGDYDRDPRARVITTAYMALVDERDVQVKAGDDAADAVWCQISIETVEEISRDTDITRRYLLHFVNQEKELDTTAKVLHILRKGLIREEKFMVEKKGMIAADHAAIIAQALTVLRGRL